MALPGIVPMYYNEGGATAFKNLATRDDDVFFVSCALHRTTLCVLRPSLLCTRTFACALVRATI